MATSLDEFLPLIINPDTKRRMTTYDDLIKYLSDQDNSTECEDLNALVEGINGWIDSSNYKVRIVYYWYILIRVKRFGILYILSLLLC